MKRFKRSRQKNDALDAEAIAEAARRAGVPQVASKVLWQQDLQSLHRSRQHLVDARTATVNHCRGLLLEYGVTIDQGITKFFQSVPVVLDDATNELTAVMRELIRKGHEMAVRLSEDIDRVERQIAELSKQQEAYPRLLTIPGVGPMGASMFLTAVGDATVFKNGRSVSAWLGLVPQQRTTGGREQLGGITKFGNPYLRAILIHGARSLIVAALRRKIRDQNMQWIVDVVGRKGWNVAAVAIANRNARMMWHLMRYDEEYRAAA